MANCPKCNAHLKLTDWKQHCPHCGANVVIYDLQERLMQDADIAEVQYYHFQKKIDRLKASFIGSKLAIARIITSILPIGPLFLPIIKAVITAPFEEYSGNISAMNIYNSIDQLGNISALLNGDTKTPTLFLAVSLASLLLSLVLVLLHFILLTLACSPKGKQRNYVIDALILITTFASLIAFAFMPDGGAITGSLGIGAYLYALLQLVNVGIDIATFKKGIEVNHKPCFVGGIPIEEYFEMVENGVSKEEIREKQYAILQEQFDKEEAIRLEKEAEAKKKKEAELFGEDVK